MNDLKLLFLDELIETALRERLIDACETRGQHVVIVQGTMRVALTPIRAHAFLRGVIQGMSRNRQHAAQVDQAYGRSACRPGPAVRSEDVPDGEEMLASFRRHLLSKWWHRYEAAGCPLGRNNEGLTLWIQHNTSTTVN